MFREGPKEHSQNLRLSVEVFNPPDRPPFFGSFSSPLQFGAMMAQFQAPNLKLHLVAIPMEAVAGGNSSIYKSLQEVARWAVETPPSRIAAIGFEMTCFAQG